MKTLEFSYGSKDVQDFFSLYQEGRLNLEPGFQRQSVWSVMDRKKLVRSIIQNYPVPSVFLYKSVDSYGRLKYDVLDGKQRLESLLMFAGLGKFKRGRFDLKISFNEGDDEEYWNWNSLKKYGHEHRITGYKIQTVEVSGSLSDIIDLFVRINSTGKRLTGQEKRHAKYYSSRFLKVAGQLGNRYLKFFHENKIMTHGMTSRMKHVELICELMASIHMQQLLNKKTALDKIISGENIAEKSIAGVKQEFIRILNLLKKVFPNLKSTRFAYSAEFYSLFMLIWEFDKAKMVLTDRNRNMQAQRLLEWLSNGVDDLRQQISKAKGAKPDQQIFASYLFTTRGDSDSSATRTRRAEVLRQLLAGLFEKKDEKRTFNKEQRRLMWNSDSIKACTSCGETLTWENFTIDHITPHSLGGPSDLRNAALMCRSCNSRKGKRTIRTVKRA
jgi:hypothetical protein